MDVKTSFIFWKRNREKYIFYLGGAIVGLGFSIKMTIDAINANTKATIIIYQANLGPIENLIFNPVPNDISTSSQKPTSSPYSNS